jgi:hypothetical protein
MSERRRYFVVHTEPEVIRAASAEQALARYAEMVRSGKCKLLYDTWTDIDAAHDSALICQARTPVEADFPAGGPG